MSGADSYDRDFMEWSEKNAGLLRARRYAEADIDHIAEEIEDMGKSRRHALASRLRVLIAHLLKHQLQPGHRSSSRRSTIISQRLQIAELLDEKPEPAERIGKRGGKSVCSSRGSGQKGNGTSGGAVSARMPVYDQPNSGRGLSPQLA